MFGLKWGLVGVLPRDVCVEASIGVNMRVPAVGACVCVWERLFLFLLTFLERFDSKSPKTPLLPPSFHPYPSFSLSFLPHLSLFFRSPFSAFICPVLPVSLSLCLNLFSQHAQGIWQRLLIFWVRIHWQFRVEPRSSFFLRRNNKICSPSVCVCVCVCMNVNPAKPAYACGYALDGNGDLPVLALN